MSISRRDFIGSTAIGGLAATSVSGAEAMPTRILGKTGARVSILAMGGGSRFLQFKEEDKAIEAVHRALERGITYIDTADDYGKNGDSEKHLGAALAGGRRQKIFLATKVSKRSGDEVQRALEQSLKNLRVDHVDLVHIHALMNEDDLEKIEAKGGPYETLQKLKGQKMTRFIGISCHNDPQILKKALERHEFDCTQMALNAAMIGQTDKSRLGPDLSFEKVALPVARAKNMGVIAMKIFAQEKLVGKATADKLIHYPLSVPGVHVAVVGMPSLDFIDQNTAIAKAFKPLPAKEMHDLSGDLSVKYKAEIDDFFADHIDA